MDYNFILDNKSLSLINDLIQRKIDHFEFISKMDSKVIRNIDYTSTANKEYPQSTINSCRNEEFYSKERYLKRTLSFRGDPRLLYMGGLGDDDFYNDDAVIHGFNIHPDGEQIIEKIFYPKQVLETFTPELLSWLKKSDTRIVIPYIRKTNGEYYCIKTIDEVLAENPSYVEAYFPFKYTYSSRYIEEYME